MRTIISIVLLTALLCDAQTFIETGRFGELGKKNGMFEEPTAIAVSSAATLYVVDSGNNRIQLFSLNGAFVKTIGGFGFAEDQFDLPLDIWTQSVINIYVSDYNNNRIQRFDRQLNYISSFNSSELYDIDYQFSEVASCAVNSQLDLFLLDGAEDKIVKFKRNDQPDRFFGNYESGSGELDEPCQLDILPDNLLAVSDKSLKSIFLFDFFGNFIQQITGPQFMRPAGLHVAQSGELYVADIQAKSIFRIKTGPYEIAPLKLNLSKPLIQPVDVASIQVNNQILFYILDGTEVIMGRIRE